MNDPTFDPVARFARILIPFALILWGMHKCRTSMQREGVNRFAFRGLMLSLGTWAFLLLQNAFTPVFPLIVSETLIAAVIPVGLWGAFLGVRGVVASRQLGAATQATLAVIIGLALPALVGYGFYSAWLERRSTAASTAPAARVAEVPAFGFTYREPGGEWIEVDTATINPNVRLAYGRSGPAMAFMIMAERAADDAVSSADLVPWLRTQLEQRGAIARFEETGHRVGSYEGTVLAQVPTHRYVVWLYANAGRVYALMLSTTDAAVPEAELLAEAERLFSAFGTTS